MLLVWLSIVCMIPFELSRLDGQTDEHRALQDAIPRRRPVVERILDTAKVRWGSGEGKVGGVGGLRYGGYSHMLFSKSITYPTFPLIG